MMGEVRWGWRQLLYDPPLAPPIKGGEDIRYPAACCGEVQSNDSDVNLSFLDDPAESSSNLWQNWKPWLEAVTGHHGAGIPDSQIAWPHAGLG